MNFGDRLRANTKKYRQRIFQLREKKKTEITKWLIRTMKLDQMLVDESEDGEEVFELGVYEVKEAFLKIPPSLNVPVDIEATNILENIVNHYSAQGIDGKFDSENITLSWISHKNPSSPLVLGDKLRLNIAEFKKIRKEREREVIKLANKVREVQDKHMVKASLQGVYKWIIDNSDISIVANKHSNTMDSYDITEYDITQRLIKLYEDDGVTAKMGIDNVIVIWS